MMNLVVAPIIQNHGDYTCPSQTDQLILFSLLALHMISKLNAVANFLKNRMNSLDLGLTRQLPIRRTQKTC
jgi:hypothetical protein